MFLQRRPILSMCVRCHFLAQDRSKPVDELYRSKLGRQVMIEKNGCSWIEHIACAVVIVVVGGTWRGWESVLVPNFLSQQIDVNALKRSEVERLWETFESLSKKMLKHKLRVLKSGFQILQFSKLEFTSSLGPLNAGYGLDALQTSNADFECRLRMQTRLLRSSSILKARKFRIRFGMLDRNHRRLNLFLLCKSFSLSFSLWKTNGKT